MYQDKTHWSLRRKGSTHKISPRNPVSGSLKGLQHWPKRWPSETFGETLTNSGTNLFCVFTANVIMWTCLVRFNMHSQRGLRFKASDWLCAANMQCVGPLKKTS